jgi:hypothetical protein
MIKKQRNKKKIYSKKRVLRGGEITDAIFDSSGVLHSLLNGTETLFSKRKILTQPVCNEWFEKIRQHQNANNIIDPSTKELILNEQRELKNATPNARIAVKFCEEKQQTQLKPYIDATSKTSLFELEEPSSLFELEEPSSLFELEEQSSLIELKEQLSVKLEQLKKLLSDNNHGYAYEICQKYLEDVFNGCMERLLHSIQRLLHSILSDTSPRKLEPKDVYKNIKLLFEHLEFKIVDPVPLSVNFPPIEGFFIGIKKHHPPLIQHDDDAFTCNAFRFFDDFVNDLMAIININNDDKTKFSGWNLRTNPSIHTLKKKLFLVLTHVDPSYISIMKRCIPEYTPVLYLKTLTSMKRANLPESVLDSLQKYYTIVVDEENDPDILGEGARAEEEDQPSDVARFVHHPGELYIPESLLVPTHETLTELTKLLKSGSYNFGYEKCEYYLKETFYRCKKILFGNIERNLQHLTPQDKEKVYDHIGQLFKHLKFKIIPELKLQRSILDDDDDDDDGHGLFIGIEKHHFISLTKNFLTSVNCDAFRYFDEFVNSLMEFINIDQENFLINGKTHKGIKFPDRRLFLVLTYVGESYKKSMTECHVKKPNLDSQVSMDMKKLGLPRLISLELYNTEPPTLASSGQGGGSKSRRKNSHKSKAKTHRHRRGSKSKSKSKSKSRRRSHTRARKHKKYTRRH